MRAFLSTDFLFTYIIGLCVSLLIGTEATISTTPNRICKTSACIEAAKLISANMDKTVHPCDNFYQFACGNYIKESLIEEDKISASVLSKADARLQSQLKENIEEKIDEDDPRTLRLLKSHYNSCLDTEKIERNSTTILLDILNDLGGWPVLFGEAWDESMFDWKRLIYQLRQKGYKTSMQSIVTFTIEIDEKNNTEFVIGLDQAETGLLYEYLTKDTEKEIVQAYYKYMVDIARALGVNKKQAKKELADSLMFEVELAKISSSVEDRRNMSQLYNPMTVAELESKYPDIPWKEYINKLLQPHYTIESNERVIVRNPNYLKYVSELISKTPKRVLANYVIWLVIQESTPFMNERFRKIEAKFGAHIIGTDKLLPRPEQCIDYVIENIPLAVGALYVRKIFNKNFKKEGEKVVEDVRQSFKKSLEKVDWMDKKTKRAALRKLKSMYAHVGYPDELLDNKILDEYFENLKVIPTSYLDSYLSLRLFEIDDTYKQLRRSYNKTEWITHGSSAVINAFYEFSENSLQIPAGFFQKELFAIDRPNYLNFGSLGYFIGHEFTHGFDDEGSQYDENGNLVNWWDHETQREYQKRAKCIVDQYSNYTVAEVGLNINGVTTQGENIADNGGMKLAYLAYEEHETQNGPEPRLPGLPYSPRQLFWLGSTNIYCEKYRPEALENVITAEEHCPGEIRTIGTLSNMPEFARDYDCPLGSFMNPVKKCTMW